MSAKDVRAILKKLTSREYGCQVEPTRRGGHVKLTRPGYPGCVTVSLSPSDPRTIQNLQADIRRQLGIRL